jgi:hypothetical protein
MQFAAAERLDGPGLHEADIALLDQVEELQAPVGVFLGDRDDEAQVRLQSGLSPNRFCVRWIIVFVAATSS